MLAEAEHSCVMSYFFKKGIPLIVPNTHYADSKALKLQSVSPLYNAQQGGLDVADVRKLGNFRYILISEIINMFMTHMSDPVRAKHVLVFKLNLK
jgi:hypothetical protein